MQWGAVLLWWVLVVALAGAALPVAAWLLPDTPDRGAGLALPVALTLVVVPAYWVGHLRFGPPAVLVGVGTLVAASVLLGRRGHRPAPRRALETLGVFTVAFLLLLAVRSVDPGAIPGGGEKFLDMGLLQSLLRAERLPPIDMWFAGERVLYYYGGHLVAATLALLTATPGRLAYNLALATAYAGATTAVYGLAGAVAADRGLPRRVAGGVGATLFGLASNLFVPLGVVATVLRGGLLGHLADATGRTVEQATVSMETFGYWWSSRVIPGTITEFPLFAYLNGDLHAHMTDTVFLLLVAAVAYAYHRTDRAAVGRRRLLVFGVVPPVIGYLGVVNTWSLPTGVGLTWLALALAPAPPRDLLPYGRTWGPGGPVRRELARLAVATVLAVAVLGLALVWVTPFVTGVLLGGGAGGSLAVVTDHTGFWALLVAQGGFVALFACYLVAVVGRSRRLLAGGLGVLAAGTVAALALAAPVLALVVPVGVAGWVLHRRGVEASPGPGGDSAPPGFEAVLIVAGVGLVTIVEFVYLDDAASAGRYNTVFKTYAQVWPLWATAGGVALAGALARLRQVGPGGTAPERRTEDPDLGGHGRGLALAGHLAAGGFLVALLLYAGLALIEHFEPYVTVWVSWWPALVVGAVALAGGVGAVRRGDAEDAPDGGVGGTVRAGLGAHPVLVGCLVVVLALHGGVAGAAGAADTVDPAPSLDALAYVHTWHAGEAPAIEWLVDRPGQPTIVAAPGTELYRWSSPASSLTGLPTVAGWAHEANYRSPAAYSERVADVDRLFRGSPATRAALLRTYEVRYVYVGQLERERYAGVDLRFGDEPGLSVAVEGPAVTVYAVDRDALVAGRTANASTDTDTDTVLGWTAGSAVSDRRRETPSRWRPAQTAISPARLTTSTASASMVSTSRKWGTNRRFS